MSFKKIIIFFICTSVSLFCMENNSDENKIIEKIEALTIEDFNKKDRDLYKEFKIEAQYWLRGWGNSYIKIVVLAAMGRNISKFQYNLSQARSLEAVEYVNEQWEFANDEIKENLRWMLTRVDSLAEVEDDILESFTEEQIHYIPILTLARIGKKILKFNFNFSEEKSKNIVEFVDEKWNSLDKDIQDNLVLMLFLAIKNLQSNIERMPIMINNHSLWIKIISRLKRLDFCGSKVDKTILGLGVLGSFSGLSLCVKDKVPFLLAREDILKRVVVPVLTLLGGSLLVKRFLDCYRFSNKINECIKIEQNAAVK